MAQSPNILLILADDHGYGDLSVHNGPSIQTPNLDRIAAGGTRFTRFYANSSVCSPSRASLMTGRFPDKVGVPGVIRTHAENNWGYFHQDAVTLPSMLKRKDYHTALIGKWHLGLETENHPCRRGFDHFHGFLGDMMDDYYTHLRDNNNYMRRGFDTITPRGHATELFTEWSAEFLQAQTQSSSPFFLYLAYNAPHTPIQPPDEWVARVREREPDISPQRAKYIALVEHMDAGIGRVLDTLEETGQLSNTLVIYTSDNGGDMKVGAHNGPLRGQKGDMYEGGIRVPACAMWPGHIPEGYVTDQVAMLIDLFPTACEVADVPLTHELEGRSIWPTLQGEQQDFSERVLYWLRREGSQRFLGQCQHAVRLGDIKLLHNSPFEPLELYNLSTDALETTNNAQTEAELFREMSGLFQAETQKSGNVPWQRGAP
ncbi:N-acetylgalactosamine 6-sulfate sulfatase [Candidatus Poribacteria bacterium]|nr:MAG: N-acetylgalactosamine 6-sulfate sulfatase [Candidatus Poribacteria bacterium]